MTENLEEIVRAAGGCISRPLDDEQMANVMAQIRVTDLYRKFKERARKDTPEHRPDEDDLRLFDELREFCGNLLNDKSEFVFLQVLTNLRRECLTFL